MTISRPSLKALAIAFVLASVSGAAVQLARPQPIESAVLGASGLGMQPDRIRAHDLRTAGPEGDPGGRNLAQGRDPAPEAEFGRLIGMRRDAAEVIERARQRD